MPAPQQYVQPYPLQAEGTFLVDNSGNIINSNNPLYVATQQTGSVNGTLQNAAGANGNGTALALLGNASVILTVTMAGFTGTVNFEVSEDNSNWSPLQVQQEGTNTIVTTTTGATSTSVTLYEGSVAGLQSLRARVSGFSAGTVTVTAHAIPTTDAPRAINANIVPVPGIVQKNKAVSSGAVASQTCAFASNNGAGNSIVVVCGVGNGTAATITDSANNTYTKAVNGNNSSTFAAQIFYATNINGGANTVTVTPSASVSVAVEVYEVSGLIAQTANILDQTASATGTGTAATTTNLVAASPNELAFAGVAVGTAAQAVSVTTGTSWTLDSTQNVGGTPSGLFTFGSLSLALGNLSTLAPAATIAGSEPWAMAVATFRTVALSVAGAVTPVSGTTGGATYYHLDSAASTNATVVKAAPGTLYTITVSGATAALRYVKFYDSAMAPTAGSGTIVQTVQVPNATTGATVTVSFPVGLAFTSGIAFVTVTTLADGGSTAVGAHDLSIDLAYR